MARDVDRQVQQYFAMEYCADKRPKAKTRVGKWLDWVVDWLETEKDDDE